MEGVEYFTPNRDTHPQFAEALCRAAENGVEILAYDCVVTPVSMKMNRPVPVVLDPGIHENFRISLGKNKFADIPIPLLNGMIETGAFCHGVRSRPLIVCGCRRSCCSRPG